MSSSTYASLWEFHTAFGQPHSTLPGLPSIERRKLRFNLLKEEYEEYLQGEEKSDLVEIADALIDMTYIIYGTGVEYGLPMDALFAEVHRSNMSKLDPATGRPIYREDGKILKPAGYSKPDLVGILQTIWDTYLDSGILPPAPTHETSAAPDVAMSDYGVVGSERGVAYDPLTDYGHTLWPADCLDGTDSIGSDVCCDAPEDPSTDYVDAQVRGYGADTYVQPIEKIAVYVDVRNFNPEAAKAHVAVVKEEIESMANSRGDQAMYFVIQTRGDTRIERI